MTETKEKVLAPRTLRIAQIDIARTVALVAMAVFHFTFDLEAFGFVERGTIASTPWVFFARLIAGSFIFLSGLSLVVGSRGGPIDRKKMMRRLAMIGGAAILVTAGTYFSVGFAYVRFGILHHMFIASLLGVALLRLPFALLGTLGIVILSLPFVLSWPLLEGAGWLWLARTSPMPPMVDYVPILPWFGVFLLGMAAAKLVDGILGWKAIASKCDPNSKRVRQLSWAGQHSLLVYLIHQPILFSAVYAARYFLG